MKKMDFMIIKMNYVSFGIAFFDDRKESGRCMILIDFWKTKLRIKYDMPRFRPW